MQGRLEREIAGFEEANQRDRKRLATEGISQQLRQFLLPTSPAESVSWKHYSGRFAMPRNPADIPARLAGKFVDALTEQWRATAELVAAMAEAQKQKKH